METGFETYPDDAELRLGFDRVRARLDEHARTPYGLERLAGLTPSSEGADVRARLASAGEMLEILAFDDPFPLSTVDDVRDALRRLAPEGASIDGQEMLALARVATVARLVHEYLVGRREARPSLWRIAQSITPVPELEDAVQRVLDERGEVRDDASTELARLIRSAARARERVRESVMHALREAAAQGWATDEQPTVRGGRAVIPVRAEARRRVPGFVHDVSATGQTVYIEPAASLDLNNELRELEAERTREVQRILRELAGVVRGRLDELHLAIDAIGRLDALSAIGRLANELGAAIPEINDSGLIRLVGASNPVLLLHVQREARETGRPPRTVVPLDLELGRDFQTLVVTGPNAGGKSVAMKTVGLLVLMAHSGIPVPARAGTSLPVFSRIFVDLGDRQSIHDDLSTFTSHLAALRSMLERADDRSLVLIDEAGTGTDPAEGGALAEAVLTRLTRVGARTIATTHHGTLKAFAHNTEGAANGSMVFDRDSLSPTYQYQSGVPGSSYAFEIAARVGLDVGVVDDARRLAGAGQVALDELVAEMEQRAREAAEARELARAEARLAADARAELEARLAKLREARDELREAAVAEAESIVTSARSEVERVVREIRESEAERQVTRAARERLAETSASIEKRRARQNRRRDRSIPLTRSTDLGKGPLVMGDLVRLDDGDTTGEVIEVGSRAVVVAFGAITSRVAPKRLTRVGHREAQRIEVKAPAGGQGALAARTRIDVRGRRVDEALDLVQRLVDEASAAGAPSVEILHGKGTGALRAAIREALATRSDVAGVETAAWNQGAEGVTVVRLSG